MKEILHNGNRLALHLTLDDVNSGLNFFTGEDEFLQLGAWRYESGKQLAAHNHNIVPRNSDRTQELVVVLKGELVATIYSEEDELIDTVPVRTGEVLLLQSGGHGYEITQEDTVVFEVKNGPYPGAETDRRRLEVE